MSASPFPSKPAVTETRARLERQVYEAQGTREQLEIAVDAHENDAQLGYKGNAEAAAKLRPELAKAKTAEADARVALARFDAAAAEAAAEAQRRAEAEAARRRPHQLAQAAAAYRQTATDLDASAAAFAATIAQHLQAAARLHAVQNTADGSRLLQRSFVIERLLKCLAAVLVIDGDGPDHSAFGRSRGAVRIMATLPFPNGFCYAGLSMSEMEAQIIATCLPCFLTEADAQRERTRRDPGGQGLHVRQRADGLWEIAAGTRRAAPEAA